MSPDILTRQSGHASPDSDLSVQSAGGADDDLSPMVGPSLGSMRGRWTRDRHTHPRTADTVGYGFLPRRGFLLRPFFEALDNSDDRLRGVGVEHLGV